ncbi:MAG: hypothetical protein HY901_18465 [Deltaproteobacteria bacterium]|nr:hypothetical protein [Deltaproteobacteria bacterium]
MEQLHRVRRSERERGLRLRVLFGLFRYGLYGFLGQGGEVLFYNLVRLGRSIPGLEVLFRFGWHVDPRLNLEAVWQTPAVVLFGQCSLWMFPVYATAAFCLIEPLYRRTARRPFWLRGLLYSMAIVGFEVVSGHALKAITGYAIWYYDDPLNVLGMSSLAILPIWFVTGLLVETLYRELMDPTVRKAIEEELANPAAPPPVTTPS